MTKKRWTEHELALAANGITPPGRTAHQVTQMRTKLKSRGVVIQRVGRRKPWKPSEDLEVMAGGTPQGRTREETRHRRQWLKVNFVDVGRGSLIGAQPICEG